MHMVSTSIFTNTFGWSWFHRTSAVLCNVINRKDLYFMIVIFMQKQSSLNQYYLSRVQYLYFNFQVPLEEVLIFFWMKSSAKVSVFKFYDVNGNGCASI
jgi:hypothetical protein